MFQKKKFHNVLSDHWPLFSLLLFVQMFDRCVLWLVEFERTCRGLSEDREGGWGGGGGVSTITNFPPL